MNYYQQSFNLYFLDLEYPDYFLFFFIDFTLGVLRDDLATDGLAVDDLATDGLAVDDLAVDDLATDDLATDDLATDDLDSFIFDPPNLL